MTGSPDLCACGRESPTSFVAPTKTAKNRIKTKMAMINVVISFASFAKDKKNL